MRGRTDRIVKNKNKIYLKVQIMSQRESFSSPLGFILAASGAAVGLGNIWGFPTQTASHGGAAFVVVYIGLVMLLGYPMLVAELTIGRYSQSNHVSALVNISTTLWQKRLALGVGLLTLLVPTLVLSFYSIVSGWFLCYFILPFAEVLNLSSSSVFLNTFSVPRNVVSTGLFSLLTILIVRSGVRSGIEHWSKRLMPMLLLLLLILFVYILFQPGAQTGLMRYLWPDFSQAIKPDLVISALGQAFFSLTLGGGVMIIYGSYLPKHIPIAKTALQVALIDTGVAFLAGLVILPAMYVALHQGVEIFSPQGDLLHSDTLIFQVLPALFNSMGNVGHVVAGVFFLLMIIAALTSSISMLEVPVSYLTERTQRSRHFWSWALGGGIFVLSVFICFYFERLFGFIIALSTQMIQPVIAFMVCIFTGWIWQRAALLKELTQDHPELQRRWFCKIWPAYVQYICPLLMAVVFLQDH